MKLKHVFFPPLTHLFVLLLLFKTQKGNSGGDLAIISLSTIYLIILTLVIGIYAFKWGIKSKKGLLFGLLIKFILEYTVLKLGFK